MYKLIKSLIHLILLILINTSLLHSQSILGHNRPYRIDDLGSVIQNDKFLNNDKCYIDSIIIQFIGYDPGKWTAQYEGGLISSYQSYYYSIGTWILMSRILLKYNNDQIILQLEQSFNDSGWTTFRKDSLCYDTAGNNIKTVSSGFENNQWVNKFLFEDIYDMSGEKIVSIYSRWENGDWNAVHKANFYYTKSGLLDYWVIQIKEDTEWVNNRLTTFFFTEKEIYEYAIIQLWNSGNWENYYKIAFTFDHNNNITAYTGSAWNDTTWNIDGRESYTFNSDRYYVSGLYEKYSGSHWYEENGTLILKNPGEPYLGFGTSRYNVYYKLTSAGGEEENSINDFSLSNYPNPFNPVTTISFNIKERSAVSLKVYDMLGREAADLLNEEKDRGAYNVLFDGAKYSSGVYICVLRTNKYSASRKILLLK